MDDLLIGPPVPTHTNYTIKSGDTLGKIAKANNISLSELLDKNPEYKNNPNNIVVGKTVRVPFKKVISSTPTQVTETGDYTIKSGDSLSKIAIAHGMSLEDLLKLNPQYRSNPNLVIVGKKINVPKVQEKVPTGQNIKDVKLKESEINKDNETAIHSVQHDGNYVILDKAKRLLTVYNKFGKPIYKSSRLSTGSSGDDYNTITYVDNKGNIKSGIGNMSTPAGITTITSVSKYHGFPAFQRARIGNDKDEIASSFHWGNICTGSNGCVRMDDRTLNNLTQYLTKGTPIYTLPEKEGSRFVVKDGKLSFIADNPYGETKGDKKYGDDYNVYVDKTYNPLGIEITDNDRSINGNVNADTFAEQLSKSKKQIMSDFGIDSDTYNDLAQLAMGIAEQETKFGTSKKKLAKDLAGDEVISFVKRAGDALNYLRNNSNPNPKTTSFFNILVDAFNKTKNIKHYNSKGYTQIKLEGDNDEMQKLYKKYNITSENINKNPNNSAIATMLRLAHIYKNEVMSANFDGIDDKYDALLYKGMGSNRELKNKTATPDKNLYIQNVKKYKDMFNYYTKYKNGGVLKLQNAGTTMPTFEDAGERSEKQRQGQKVVQEAEKRASERIDNEDKGFLSNMRFSDDLTGEGSKGANRNARMAKYVAEELGVDGNEEFLNSYIKDGTEGITNLLKGLGTTLGAGVLAGNIGTYGLLGGIGTTAGQFAGSDALSGGGSKVGGGVDKKLGTGFFEPVLGLAGLLKGGNVGGKYGYGAAKKVLSNQMARQMAKHGNINVPKGGASNTMKTDIVNDAMRAGWTPKSTNNTEKFRFKLPENTIDDQGYGFAFKNGGALKFQKSGKLVKKAIQAIVKESSGVKKPSGIFANMESTSKASGALRSVSKASGATEKRPRITVQPKKDYIRVTSSNTYKADQQALAELRKTIAQKQFEIEEAKRGLEETGRRRGREQGINTPAGMQQAAMRAVEIDPKAVSAPIEGEFAPMYRTFYKNGEPLMYDGAPLKDWTELIGDYFQIGPHSSVIQAAKPLTAASNYYDVVGPVITKKGVVAPQTSQDMLSEGLENLATLYFKKQ